MPGKYDLVVVGAGPAGAMTAKTAAEKGLKVLMLERGRWPGEKNTSGSAIFYVPRYWKWLEEGPVNRVIWGADFYISLGLSIDETVCIRFPISAVERVSPEWQGLRFFDVYRNEWDKWVAEKAVEAGAELRTKTLVTGVVRDDKGFVRGVVTEGGERIEAEIVVGADGVNSIVARTAGLRPKWDPSEVTLAVKYDVELPEEVIEERFAGLDDGSVVFHFWFSNIWSAGPGTYAWIFPHKNSVSVATYGILDELARRGVNPEYLLTKFLRHPMVRRLLKGGKVRYRTAHMIPMGAGYKVKPYGNGVMLVGDAAGFVSAIHGGGIGGAYRGGQLAAEVAAEAISEGNVSEEKLREYRERLMKEAEGIAGVVHGASREMKDYTKWFYEEVGVENLGKILLEAPHALMGGPKAMTRFVMKTVLPVLPVLARIAPMISKPIFDLLSMIEFE